MEYRKRGRGIRFRRQSQDRLPVVYMDNIHEVELPALHDSRGAQVQHAGTMDSRVAYLHRYRHSQCETEQAVPVVQPPQTSHAKGYPARAYASAAQILVLVPHDER